MKTNYKEPRSGKSSNWSLAWQGGVDTTYCIWEMDKNRTHQPAFGESYCRAAVVMLQCLLIVATGGFYGHIRSVYLWTVASMHLYIQRWLWSDVLWICSECSSPNSSRGISNTGLGSGFCNLCCIFIDWVDCLQFGTLGENEYTSRL